MSMIETAAHSTSASPRAYNVERIRSDFPILYRDVYGKPLAYLDNAASAQKPKSVIDAMTNLMTLDYANVHRGMHYLSNASTAAYEKARATTAAFINAPKTDQIIFTKNATEAINLVAASFGLLEIGEGDEIVLSIMEHHSNIVPWHYHRERKGAVLKWAPMSDDGVLDLDALDKLIGPKTKILTITHMSNALGTVNPIKEICRIAHAKGVPVFVDGSQGAVHLSVDVQELDCDFYCFTGHKVYGPTGIGVLYAKRRYLDSMPPYGGGGEMIEHVAMDKVRYGVTPHKFEAGTPPIIEAVGLGAALEYMMQTGREAIARHEHELLVYATERFSELNDATIYGRAPGKGAIISFSMDRLHPHDISTIIDRSGVAVRAGHHCAQPLMERLGVSATCRASFAMYNTKAEVDQLIAALKKARAFFG